MNITTIIPVYKNTKGFIKFFKHNYPFIEDTKIIIIDDDSGENLKKEIEKQYNNVTVLTNIKNIGYAASVNKGIKMAETQYILLLNSDVKLIDSSYLNGIQEFKDEKLFAISFQQIEKDKSHIGKNKLYFKRGLILHSKATDQEKGKNGWAEGGSCLIRKEYFERLNGFDLLYKPFYWEDIDLSYRAYKNGWYVLFDPSITVEHHHESTIGTHFDKETIKTVAYRNQLLFIWKNISDKRLVLLHRLWLPVHLVMYPLKGQFIFLKSFIMALGRIGEIPNQKTYYDEKTIISDIEILKQYE